MLPNRAPSQQPELDRDDVVSAYLSVLGRPPETEAIIDFQIATGLDRWGLVAALAGSLEAQTRLSRRPICFVHIPKTAGSSMMAAISAMVGYGGVYWRGETEPFGDFDKRTTAELRSFRVVGGHIRKQQLAERVGKDATFVAVVRDPVARARSYFHYASNKWNSGDSLRQELSAMGLETALNESPRFVRYVANAQCTMICGEPSFEAAVDEIIRNKWIVGDMGSVPAVLKAIANQLSVPAPADIPRLNVGEPSYADTASPRAVTRLRELNVEDAKLVEFLGSIGGRFMTREPRSEAHGLAAS